MFWLFYHRWISFWISLIITTLLLTSPDPHPVDIMGTTNLPCFCCRHCCIGFFCQHHRWLTFTQRSLPEYQEAPFFVPGIRLDGSDCLSLQWIYQSTSHWSPRYIIIIAVITILHAQIWHHCCWIWALPLKSRGWEIHPHNAPTSTCTYDSLHHHFNLPLQMPVLSPSSSSSIIIVAVLVVVVAQYHHCHCCCPGWLQPQR